MRVSPAAATRHRLFSPLDQHLLEDAHEAVAVERGVLHLTYAQWPGDRPGWSAAQSIEAKRNKTQAHTRTGQGVCCVRFGGYSLLLSSARGENKSSTG